MLKRIIDTPKQQIQQPQQKPTSTPPTDKKPVAIGEVQSRDFQSTMKRLHENVQDYQRIMAAFKSSTNTENITTVEQYNESYGTKDAILNGLIVNLTAKFRSYNAYHFGHKIDFAYGDGSILVKPACNCTHDNVPVKEKKTARKKAENFLDKWALSFKKWANEGYLKIAERNMFDKPLDQPKSTATILPKTKEKTKEQVVLEQASKIPEIKTIKK